MKTTDAFPPVLLELPESAESGQAAISLVLILGLFLLGVFGFAVDLTNIWFHRQTATAASDAACQAAALDMLSSAGGLPPPAPGFTAGTAGNCVSSSSATMCTYAKLNGYDGAGLNANAASNAVSWTFPASLPGVTAGAGTYPFLKLSISENIRTYFISLVNASHFQTINVTTTCGLALVNEAAPMIVLDPIDPSSFKYSGTGALDILGGPGRGLQVNSSSATAVGWTASAIIDLSAGGPNHTGSDVGIVGGPTTIPTNGSSSGFNGGTTGAWKSSVLPVPDPFSSVHAPSLPANAPAPKWVQYAVDGCPDHYNNVYVNNSLPNESCLEFYPGYYPSGMNLGSLMNNYATAIFAPGIYYLNGSLTIGGSEVVRMAAPAGSNPTQGLMFYFLTGSLNLSGGSSSHVIDPVSPSSITCDGNPPISSLGIPLIGISGNVLVAQCTTRGTYYDSAGDTTDSAGTPGSPGSRGLLFFEAHANPAAQAAFGGSAGLAFSGTMYFHSTTAASPDVLSMSGAGTSGTFIVGEIVSDQVILSGSGTIKLALNPAATTSVSKVSIFN
jgi:hypothetical protein